MKSATLFFILSNVVSAINCGIIIYSSLLTEKKDYILSRILTMTLSILVYILSSCWASVVVNIFTILRDYYSIKAKKQNVLVIILFCVLGSALSFYVSNIETITWSDFIPALSMILFTVCLFKAKTAGQMKVATAIDTVFWIVYDFKNFLIVNVILDIYLMLLPPGEMYASLLRSRIFRREEK